MTRTGIQGPLPLGRIGGVKVDFWWDQGNAEAVKRATTIMHKAQKPMLEHGGFVYSNMFGAGEYHCFRFGGGYSSILRKSRRASDPANLMHPDVLLVTDDCV